jgi:predicted metal-dependent peptidase
MRPSRRFGEEQKGRVALRRLHLAVAIDTSGSISTEQLCLFAAEVRNLAASYRSAVTVLECDAQVQKVYPLRGLQVDMRFKGRGGTDFNPVFDHLREERVPANVLIFLTDLYGAFPGRAPPYPVLWVVPPGSAGERVPFGRKIVLDADSRGGGR